MLTGFGWRAPIFLTRAGPSASVAGMKTYRIAALALFLALAALLGAQKPADRKYTADGRLVDHIAVKAAAGSEDAQRELDNAKTIAGWVEQVAKARTPLNRSAAISVLSRIGWQARDDKRQVPEQDTMAAGLSKALQDKDQYVRLHAAEALWLCATKASVPALVKMAGADPEYENRRAAVRALGSVKGPESLKALEQIIKNTKADEGIRTMAVRSLGEIGGAEGKAALERIQQKQATPAMQREIDEQLDKIEGLGE